MKLATAFVEVRPDLKGFKPELERNVTADATAVSKRLGSVLAGGAFLAGAKKATDAASQLQQAVGGTAAVFGDSADAVEDWSKRAADAAGLSERAARELTSQIGGLLKGFGFTSDEAANLSIELAQLGADLAATFGGTPEDAVTALGAALRGETDPLERFGIALNQTLVNQRAVELGLAATTSAVDQQAKAQATLSLITERSADAQGQFAREADTAAGQAARAAAKAENSAADLGENLLPIYTQIAETVGAVADVFGSLPGPVQTGLVALAGIAVVAGPAKAAAEVFTGLVAIARRAPQAFNRAAEGAYSLAGGFDRVAGRALGLATQLGLVYGAVTLLDREADRADLSKLANDLLNLGESGKLAGEAASVLGTDFRTLQNAIEDIAKPSTVAQIDNAVFKLSHLGLSDDNDLEQSRQVIEDLDQALADLASRDPSAAAQALEAIVEGLSPADAERLVGLLDEYDSKLADVDTTQRTTRDSTKELTEELSLEEQAAEDAAEAFDAFREAVEKALLPLDFEEAVDNQRQALDDLAQGIADRAQAVEDAERRLHELRTMKKEDRPDDFARQVKDAQRDLDDAIAATSLTLEGNSDAARRNREELRGLVDETVGIIEAAREEGRSVEDLQLIRANEITNLEKQLEQMGLNREEIRRYIDRINEIPLSKETVLDIDTAKADRKLEAALARWQKELDENPLSVDVLQSEKFLGPRRSVRGFAAGTAQVTDGLFSVGERGPELMRKHGAELEVIAGSPAPVAFDGVSEQTLLELRQLNALMTQLVANSSASRGGALRRVKLDAGAL